MSSPTKVSIEKQLDDLYMIHDYDFNAKATKQRRILLSIAAITTASNSFEETGTGVTTKAFAAYAKGRALNATEEFDPEAEKLLSRAVKLDSSIVPAWNALGTSFWKKGDLPQARRCFEGANNKKKNKVSDRELSMLLRNAQLVAPSDNSKADTQARYDNFKASVVHAKSAVSLDFKDGRSWYYLGNAYLFLFFNVTQSTADLNKALKAYKGAEKNGEVDRNPDLHFNRANVFKYLERYTEAAASYKKAMGIDSSLPAEAALNDMRRQFNKVAGLVQNKKKAQMKPKRLAALLQDIPTDAMVAHPLKQGTFCDVITLSDCKLGLNDGKAVFVKSTLLARHGSEPPAVFIVSDKQQTVMPVSVYNLNKTSSARVSKSVLTIINPTLVQVAFGDSTYVTVQVSDPRLFLVDGKVLVDSIALPLLKMSLLT